MLSYRLIGVYIAMQITAGCLQTVAQNQSDSTAIQSAKKSKIITNSEWIIPAVFITSGSAIALDKDADEFFINNYDIRNERNESFKNFSITADNYLQYAPAALGITLGLCGVRGRNDLANQTAILIKSEILVALIVLPLKEITRENRPDTGEKNSFPSGHTTQAFAAATFLAKEYGHKNVWYSIGAYTVATAVGSLRILNDRHWVSDVIAGAGIGILCTNIVYATHQHKWGKRKNSLTFTPTYNKQAIGFYLCYKY